MLSVITIGEMLVEIIRKKINISLRDIGEFIGPFPSGAPAIFIDAIAKLGMGARIIGAVGCDEFGECILSKLAKDGVDISMVKRIKDAATGVAFVSYFLDGSRRFIFHARNSAAGMIDENDICMDYVQDSSLIHISGSSLFISNKMQKACYKIVEIGKKAGAIISFDPNIRKELGLNRITEIFSPILKACSLFIPTGDELKLIFRDMDEERAIRKMFNKGVELVAVKNGKKGCRIYKRGQKIEVPAFNVKEVDPTGAGDAFSAAIVVGYLKCMDLNELGLFANAAGAKAVTAMGPMEGLASWEEIKRMMKSR